MKPRSLYRYDLLRVLATFAVVWLHVSMYAVLYEARNSAAWWVGNVFDSASRWCVPMFVLISGALLLGPREESPQAFYRKRLNRLLIPLAFWSAFYLCLKLAAGTVTLSEAALSLWRGRPHYHLWFLYMVLGLYLVTPLLRAISARNRVRLTYLFLGGSICGSIVAFFIGWQGTFFTLFVPYLGYYLLGYRLTRLRPAIKTWLLWIVLAASTAVVACGAGWLVHAFGVPRGLFPYSYVGLPVLVMSTSAYLLGLKVSLFTKGADPRVHHVVAALAKASLGVYLVHPLLLEAVERAFGSGVYLRWPLLSIPAWSALVFAASAAFVLALLRVPCLRRLV